VIDKYIRVSVQRHQFPQGESEEQAALQRQLGLDEG
jgi:hypothetical protein